MGMPTIPDISPEIRLKKEEIVNLLLASIGFEELGLAHIINAEAEKIQKVLGTLDSEKSSKMDRVSIEDMLKVNASVNKTLQEVVKKEILLQYKFDNVLEFCKLNCGCNDEGHSDEGRDKGEHRREEQSKPKFSLDDDE